MCTAISYLCGDHYFGRTLDYERSFGEEVVLMPRNASLFMRLSPNPPHNHFSPHAPLTPYSRGMGAIGLSGKLISCSFPERCLRAGAGTCIDAVHIMVYPGNSLV